MNSKSIRRLFSIATLLGMLLVAVPMASADFFVDLPSSMPAGAGDMPQPVMQPQVDQPDSLMMEMMETIVSAAYKPFVLSTLFF